MAKKSKTGGGSVGRETRWAIGRQLRIMYDDIVDEGVPERFIELLRRLDKPTDDDASQRPKA
jgi:hypothetical protein